MYILARWSKTGWYENSVFPKNHPRPILRNINFNGNGIANNIWEHLQKFTRLKLCTLSKVIKMILNCANLWCGKWINVDAESRYKYVVSNLAKLISKIRPNMGIGQNTRHLNGKDQVWILNVDVDDSNLTKTKMRVTRNTLVLALTNKNRKMFHLQGLFTLR